MNEELKERISGIKPSTLRHKVKPNSRFYQLARDIIAATSFLPSNTAFSERMYYILNDLTTIKLCKCGCGEPVKQFKSDFALGHNSRDKELQAKIIANNFVKYGVSNPAQLKSVKDKRKRTCLERYGVENSTQSAVVQNKMKQTCLEKYGVENVYQSEIFKEKIKQTALKKFGVENPAQSKEVQDKMKQTCIERYGVDNALKNEEIKDKVKQTNLERYGVGCVFQSEDIKEQIKQTCIERYGVDHPLKCDEVMNKIKQTNLERYNVECTFQSEDVKEKIKQTCIEKYGAENPSQSAEIKQKKIETCLKNHGVEHSFQSAEIREKSRQTCIENRGVDYPMQSEEVRDKSKQTCLKNYGFEYATQSNEIKNKISAARLIHFYNSLVNGNRLENKVVPLFSLDEYNGCADSYKFKCITCNHEFESNVIIVPRCPICYPKLIGQSKIELSLIDYIKSIYTGKIITGDRKILYGLELDVYLPDLKIAIEVDGLYWHSELNGKDKDYHLNKTLDCAAKGIQLIHIFEDELMNYPKIVYSYIRTILQLNTYKINALDCIIKPIDAEVCFKFLTKYNLNSYTSSNIMLGAFYKNRLVAATTLNKLADNNLCITRFSIINNFEIKNVLNCFLKHPSVSNCCKIIYPINLRWESTALFQHGEFTFKTKTTPVCWYLKGYVERASAKEILIENEIEESDEISPLILNEYDKIWDCGSLIYQK